MVRLALFWGWVLLATSMLAVEGARAQSGPASEPLIRLEAEDTPLGEVLEQLAAQAGIDVVFAERTVEGRAVTGRYVGDDPEGALRTVLRGSALRAERVRPRQYVIVPALPAPVPDWLPALRGTLDGTVVDDETGETLPGAHVILAGLGLGTITNAAGYFALPDLPAGAYRVRVSFVGYRPAEVELPVYPESKLERPVVRLVPQAVVVGNILVEGADGERRDLETVPGTTVVSTRTAEALPSFLGESDLFSAMEWLPGVARSGEAGGELIVRGAEAQYNRYLLDGAPVIHPWHTFGLFSAFQPEVMKSVRLHRGSLPAEHGGGLSAVLDLEMKDGERQGVRGVAALSPVSVRGVVEAPLSRRASLMVSARRTWLDLFLQPQLRIGPDGGLPSFTFDTADEMAGDQEGGYYFYDLGAKATWRVADGQRLSLSVYAGGDRLDRTAPLSTLFGTGAAALAEPPPDAPLRYDLSYGWGNRVFSGRYRGLVRDDIFLTATAYHSRYFADEQSFARATAVSSTDTEYRVRHAESGLRLDADYYLSLEHQLRAGLRLVGRDFESALSEERRRSVSIVEGRTEASQVRALEAVAYVQDTWQPSAGWQLQPGLRVEVFGPSGLYVSVNPRFHLRHDILRDRLLLRAGISRQTQALHRVRDQYAYTYDLASDRWIPASDRVRPASAWQAAVGLEWLPARGLSLGVEAYGRRLADILLPRDPFQRKNGLEGPGITPGALLDQYVAGTGRALGLEWRAELERGRWRGGLAYSLSRVQERVPGDVYRPARYDAPHQVEVFAGGGGSAGRSPWRPPSAAATPSSPPPPGMPSRTRSMRTL